VTLKQQILTLFFGEVHANHDLETSFSVHKGLTGVALGECVNDKTPCIVLKLLIWYFS